MSVASMSSPAAIVAIPAHDEAERIGACLAALAMQRDATGAPLAPDAFEVLLLANNCRDGTATLARTFGAIMPFRLHVVEQALPANLSHAGGARRVALDLAADRLAEGPVGDALLLTTDADSRVAPDWVAANRAAIRAGADAVAGYVDAEPDEYLALGRGFLDRGRLEDRFLARVAELHARLDPRPHDPWPNHRVHSGASFAVTLAAYRAIGGLPVRALGEDAALAVALEEGGFHIRHSLDAVVTTSCRFDGRARGGAGDTMKFRHAELDAPCDGDLEPAVRLFRRVRARALLRRLHESGRLREDHRWRGLLGLDAEAARRLLGEVADLPFVGAWAHIEVASPALRPGPPLRPSMLALETERLERLLRRLTIQRSAGPADSAARGAPPPIAVAAGPP